MPSLNLRNPLRRDPSRPTLKQRAAAIKATAGRVMRRRAVEVAPAAPGADPRLTAMVADLLEARRKLNDPSVPDGPEADAIGERETALSMAVYRFPARSIHDMAAKLPFLRDEAEDAGRAWDVRRGEVFENSLPGAAWTGLLRDIAHLAGVASQTQAQPDPIFAAINVSKSAHRVMDLWSRTTGEKPLTEEGFEDEARLNKAQCSAHDAVLATVPTTAAGRLALLEYLRWQMGLYGMADGQPPEADSAFWPDAYKALKAALAFEDNPRLSASQNAAAEGERAGKLVSPSKRDLSREAFDYAYGLDLSAVSFSNLRRLYEVFTAAHELLWPVEGERMFDEGTHLPCWAHTPGGVLLDAEINRMSCLRDAMASELRRRSPKTEGERNARLEVLIAHEIRCETKIWDRALLAEINAAWGA